MGLSGKEQEILTEAGWTKESGSRSELDIETLAGKWLGRISQDKITGETIFRGPRNMLVSLNESEVMKLQDMGVKDLRKIFEPGYLYLILSEPTVKEKVDTEQDGFTNEFMAKMTMLREMAASMQREYEREMGVEPGQASGEAGSLKEEPSPKETQEQLVDKLRELQGRAREAELDRQVRERREAGLPPVATSSERVRELLEHPPISPDAVQPSGITGAIQNPGTLGTRLDTSTLESGSSGSWDSVLDKSESTDWGRECSDLSDQALEHLLAAAQFLTVNDHQAALEHVVEIEESDIDAAIQTVGVLLTMLNGTAAHYQMKRIAAMEQRKARLVAKLISSASQQ
jgi:hypothetical protein